MAICRLEHNIIDPQVRVDIDWLRFADDFPTLAPGFRERLQKVDLATALPIGVQRAFGSNSEYAGLKPLAGVSELEDCIFERILPSPLCKIVQFRSMYCRIILNARNLREHKKRNKTSEYDYPCGRS